MGYLIRLRVYERVGVSLVEVCEWVGKSVISVVKRLKRADRSNTFYLCEKVERTFCFCSLFIFNYKTVNLHLQLKWMESPKLLGM